MSFLLTKEIYNAEGITGFSPITPRRRGVHESIAALEM
jgi:hypothetical protein